MEKNTQFRHILLLNLAMICISTSGVLGRHISMAPPLTIWWRAFFAIFFLGIFCFWKKYAFSFDRKKYGKVFFISGALMAIHWVTYFYALHLSNVAVAMLSLFTYPVMTALLEPIILKTKFEKHHLLSSLLVLVGIYFLAPELKFSNSMTQGLVIGLISALSYSIRNILLKTQVTEFNGSVLMFYQMVITTILIFPVLFFYDRVLDYSQIPFILFLSLITTAVGHTLFLNSFKYFSVSTASIMSGLQPIYGIILAIIFLQEIPDWRSWIGGGLILLTVMLESRLNLKSKK